jgi:hypothetical protein
MSRWQAVRGSVFCKIKLLIICRYISDLHMIVIVEMACQKLAVIIILMRMI